MTEQKSAGAKEVWITGIGIVSSLGEGLDAQLGRAEPVEEAEASPQWQEPCRRAFFGGDGPQPAPGYHHEQEHPQQPGEHLWRGVAAGHRQPAVRPPAVQDQAAVERDQVTVSEPALTGNPVHHLVVDGHAERVGEALEAEKAGDAAVVADERLGLRIEIQGGEAGAHRGGEVRQTAAQDPSGSAHALDLLGSFETETVDAHRGQEACACS